MAYRRILNTPFTRQITFSLLSSHSPHHLPHLPSLLPAKLPFYPYPYFPRSFSSHTTKKPNSRPHRIEIDDDDDDEEEDGDEEEGDYTSAEEEGEGEGEDEVEGNVGKRSVNEPACFEERSYCVEDKIVEAGEIGYKVVGPLETEERVFKRYESAFAVVQIGSHQFKVSNGDCIYVEKLKYCEVNDKLVLTKVMMVGSPTQTIIGRPILPETQVHAVVEEHALDAKVIIFKKKRRKNYRRTRGHRQELTRLRITDIQGIEKVAVPFRGKSRKSVDKTVEKVAMLSERKVHQQMRELLH